MRPALSLAKDRRTMLFIAGCHALTSMNNADQLRRLPYDVAASWLAAGSDPEMRNVLSSIRRPGRFCCKPRVELMHMIRERQMHDDGRGLSAAQQFYLLAE
jgi:hypothetical protein